MGKKWPVRINLPFFAVEAYAPGGGGPESGRKIFEKCLPAGAGTGTKIYFSRCLCVKWFWNALCTCRKSQKTRVKMIVRMSSSSWEGVLERTMQTCRLALRACPPGRKSISGPPAQNGKWMAEEWILVSPGIGKMCQKCPETPFLASWGFWP